MFKFFAPDSLFSRIFGTAADLILLNFLFLLTSLPILTIGASCTALCRGVHAILEATGSPVKTYLTAFRREWKQATVIWLILLALAVVAAADILWAMSFESISVAALLPAILTALVFLSVSAYVFPLLSRFENSTFQMLKNALILAFANPLKTLLIVISNLLPAVMLLFFPYWFLQLGFIWLTLGFSLICYSNMRLLRSILTALENSSDSQENDAGHTMQLIQ